MFSLDHHADMHQNGQFRCERCQINFTNVALQVHNRQYHFRSDLSAQCSICTLKFTSFIYLGNLTLNCRSGGFLQFTISEQHMKVHVNGDVKCEICQIKFTSHSLICHQRRFHPNVLVPKPHNPAAAVRKVTILTFPSDLNFCLTLEKIISGS